MTIKTMLESIVDDNLSESTITFKSVLADKVKDKLQEKKQTFARNIFTEATDYSEVEAIAESLYEDKDHDSIEPDDDADDKEFLQHPKHQLDLIASHTKNKPEEDYEMTKSGVPSMHSVKAHAAKGDVDTAPKFKHKNGEESNPSKADAHHILLHIDQMKPDLRTKVFQVMHGSKDGFAKVAAALKSLPVPKSNSIYSK
jgi:hypothetical protein